MDNNPEDCPVCLTVFDDTLRRPRNLPCGHSFCTCCIDALKVQGEVTCPTCRLSHAVPEAGQFPVSYVTEALVKRLRGADFATPPPKRLKEAAEPAALLASKRCQEGTPGLSRLVQSLLQEQESKVLAAIHTCQGIQAQLHDYQTTLVDWGERQQHLEDRLQALMDQSKSARNLVLQEKSKVAVKREEEQQVEQQLHAVLQELRTVSTRPEAYKVIDDAEYRTDEEKQSVEECRAMFPDVDTVTTIKKVKEVSSAALEAATGVQAAQETAGSSACATEDSYQLAAPASSIKDRLKALMAPPLKVKEVSSAALEAATGVQAAQETAGSSACATEDSDQPAAPASSIKDRLKPLMAPPLKVREAAPRVPPAAVEVEDLRSLTQSVRKLLQDGLVFAVHQAEGQSRHGRISLKDDRLHLHSLQDQPLPTGASTVQMDQVVPAAPPCLVFLDLAWPGSASRRVLIRLDPDTPMGQQFILLCTGQRGACYANTKLFKAGNSEWCRGVWGGDYQYSNGKGGAALLPRLDSVKNRSLVQAGHVCVKFYNLSKGAQFRIITEVMKSRTTNTFGKVVDGLEVVLAASKHHTITEVTVVDCGVVLWA